MSVSGSHGLWVAYYGDWSAVALFMEELECLRHAVDNSMQVSFVRLPCLNLKEAVNES